MMMMSHMESEGQRWPNVPNVRLGDASAASNFGFSDMMMNNLWMYDFNMLEESQNNLFSWFPVQESPEYAISILRYLRRVFCLIQSTTGRMTIQTR
ncbi:hypothetical protein HanPI659440_Chr13g0523351 [Helianthus annuus]|nr:hypothetical protein HanPI659440_Chr13g0523351 [Helianthus annuus]